MKPWRVYLNGTEITRKVAQVQTSFVAGNIAGSVKVDLADRAVLDGIVLPRVPRELAIVVDKLVDGLWVSQGSHFLEQIEHTESQDALTAEIWGRTRSARLGSPFAQKISKQWPGETTFNAIVQEMAALCGVVITMANDYPVCQYCYAVSDWTPAQIIQDLAAKSGQVLWPQVDGSIVIAPRLYRNLPAPDVVLVANEIEVMSVQRQVPDFGNRILVSGDGAVAGLSVTVVPMYNGEECVSANGQDKVRLIAIVLGQDGNFVPPGTVVEWGCSGGTMQQEISATGYAEVIGETQRARDYHTVTLDLPASAVIGVYAYDDVRRSRNLYVLRRGSVDRTTITFASSLDYFDQALIIDYEVEGATNTWISGWIPGDVLVLASVAGAQGNTTLHQSNPTACASTITMESVPTDVCIGGSAVITIKSTMFGGMGTGMVRLSLDGCGTLSSTQKQLTSHAITEELSVTNWGGVSQVRLSAVPSSEVIDVHLESAPAVNLYESRDGQTLNLDTVLLSGTKVIVTYQGGGTAMVRWAPDGDITSQSILRETLLSTDVGGVSHVALSRTPISILIVTQSPTYEVGPNLVASNVGPDVTLNTVLPAGTTLYCKYWVAQALQPNCEATITAKVADGSQDGGIATLRVTAKDCREQSEDPDPPEETSPDDPDTWVDKDDDDEEPEDPEGWATSCEPEAIDDRVPKEINDKSWDAVAGVSAASDCPGLCTCDQICAAVRSSGKLSRGGYFYSQCMEKCTAKRAEKCTACVLDGPETLSPGVVGTWTDNKGNNGQFRGGGLALVERTPTGGYKAKMPSGGSGPFTVKVCYGDTEDSCCTAQVAFPPCSLSGVDQLDPGTEALYLPSAGMEGAVCTCAGDMEFVRLGGYGIGFVCRMKPNGCSGTVSVTYGGVICGTITVANPKQNYVGTVVGPDNLDFAEVGVFYHDLGPGASYTGNLPKLSDISGEGGNGVTVVMPANAAPGSEHTVSFSGVCGSSASKTVAAGTQCTAPTHGTGDPTGSIVSLNGGQYCAVVGEICNTISYPIPPNNDSWAVVSDVSANLDVGGTAQHAVRWDLHRGLPPYADCAVIAGQPGARVTLHKVTITRRWW